MVIVLADVIEGLQSALLQASALDESQEHEEAHALLRRAVEEGNGPWSSDMDEAELEQVRELVQRCDQEADRQHHRYALLQTYLVCR